MTFWKINSVRTGHRRWQILGHNPWATSGLVLVSIVTLSAIGAPLLPLADPTSTDLANRMLPVLSSNHVLGTDHLGRDLLARTVWGARASLAVGVFATLIAAFCGTLIGLVAGYYRRGLDAFLMRGIDIVMAFPYLLLALAIVAALGPSLRNAMIAIAVVNIPFFARAVRGSVIRLSQLEFIAAARLSGLGDARILITELLPNVLPAIVVLMGTTLGWMILETAGLSFLGLGAQPPRADLGSMLGEGRQFLTTMPRVAIVPGLAILVAVVGINLFGDGLRDMLDPRLQYLYRKGRKATTWAPEATFAEIAYPTDESALLNLAGVSVHFATPDGISRAVNEVSFSLRAGERLALVGESGSGKTMTALAILGLVPPPGRIVEGHINYRSENLLRVSSERLRELRGNRITYVAQDPSAALNPVFTVGAQLIETLREHQTITFRQAQRRTLALFEQVRLPEPPRYLNAYPHELSGGMRQRVLIAMALANDPKLIIADEATTALDVTVQAEILKLLDELCKKRRTALLFITHNLAAASQLCDRMAVMYAGQVVEFGLVTELLARPCHPYTRALLACVPELGKRHKPLIPIPGTPPSAKTLPRGCYFSPRCEFSQTQCQTGAISLRTLTQGHEVRCLRAEAINR